MIGARRHLLSRPRIDPDVRQFAATASANAAGFSRRRLRMYSKFWRRGKRRDWVNNLVEFYWMRPEGNGTASALTQCVIGWKTRIVGTPMGSPAATENGLALNGTDQYIQSGIIPNAAAYTQWDGSHITAGGFVRGPFNAGYMWGVNEVSGSRNLAYRARAAGVANALLNAVSTNGPATSNATGHSSANRIGSSGAFLEFRTEGVATGTATPGTNGTTMPSTELYFGALNTAGVASVFLKAVAEYAFLGNLTAAQELAMVQDCRDLRDQLPYADTYVSNVDFGGIPIGSDTGLGTAAAPFLTLAAGVLSTPPGSRVLLNGDTASPATYGAGVSTTISTAVTVKAINSLGAKIEGTGTTRCMILSPTSGQTINLEDLIIDGTTQGAARCIDLTSQALLYAVNARRCKITGFTQQGIYTPSAAPLVQVNTYNCIIVAAGCRSGIYLADLQAGGLSSSEDAITLTDQNLSGHGGIVIKASVAGVTCNIYKPTISVTLDATLTLTGTHVGIWVENVASAIIDGGGTGTVSVLGAPGSRQGAPIRIVTNLAGDATELPINGGIIRNFANCQNTTNGGVIFQFGDDGGDKTKAVGGSITNNIGTGNASFVAGAGHGLFACNTTTSTVSGNTITTTAIAAVNKRSNGTVFSGNTLTDASSSYLLVKGSLLAQMNTNIISAGASYAGSGLDMESDGGVDSTGSATGNSITNAGASGMKFLNGDASNLLTLSTNTYTKSSGTLDANPWTYDGVNYATFAAWQAIEPTAINGGGLP